MKRAAFLAAAALLVACASAGFSNPAYPQYSSPGPRNVLDMGTVVGGVTSGLINLPGRITSGKFVVKDVGKATPKVPVSASLCLAPLAPRRAHATRGPPGQRPRARGAGAAPAGRSLLNPRASSHARAAPPCPPPHPSATGSPPAPSSRLPP
jgi:hypothetical protein